jgi:two-component sensor histidine kinase
MPPMTSRDVLAHERDGLERDITVRVQAEQERELGLQLINDLARHQLGGQTDVDRSAGTTFKITFTDRGRKKV